MIRDDALRALEALPSEMRERALARLQDDVEKLRVLKSLIEQGSDEADSGAVADWDPARLIAELDEEERTNPQSA